MASLCEAAPEPCLKRLFICRSAGVRDNRDVNKQPLRLTRPTAKACAARGALPARWAACCLLALCALAGHGGAAASNNGDHERALQAVQSGQVLPLAKVLSLLEKAHPGQVLEVELESEGQAWLYEIKLLQPDGRLTKLKIDARTGEILKRKTR
jgi:hypothetical protein